MLRVCLDSGVSRYRSKRRTAGKLQPSRTTRAWRRSHRLQIRSNSDEIVRQICLRRWWISRAR